MPGRSRLAASAVVGSVLLLGTPGISSAQRTAALAQPVGRLAAFSPGAIHGVVRDETGTPVSGATVSVVGPTTSVAVTDRDGRFELRTLSPGPYLVHAHLSGYVAPRAQVIQVSSNGRTVSSIALRRAGAATILAASVGAVPDAAPLAAVPDAAPAVESDRNDARTASSDDDDHNEIVWRIRHARRGILKQATLPGELLADGGASGPFAPVDFLGRAMGSSARLATSLLTDASFSGQVNLLTTGSFDTPQQLFSSSGLSRGIAYIRLGAPAGNDADWTVRGALNQANISSWIVAGSYATRSPARRHRYDIGMSYSTQRYDGGSALAIRDVTDGSRNAGTVYAFETFTVTPSISVTYGARYAQYDYLDKRGLLSPRVEVTTTPAEHLRVSAQMSRRALAPGAEEFLPPGDSGIWLPPQRTFSSIAPDRSFEAEHASHSAVEVERDIAGSTVSLGVFHQRVDDQLVTLFGADVPDRPSAKFGHYFVGNAGAVDANGCSAAFRTTLVNRIHGSVTYSMTRAQLMPSDDLRYLILLAPSAGRRDAERIHDVSTSIETSVPETATRVLVLYRVSNAFARSALGSEGLDRSGLDSRFDVQVRQSLPFMNFSNAKWEMLLAVRNFFRETVDQQSVYDELLVVRPPKRIVGGVTMRF
jgi:Carboxypeptidase regulatory-like domain/TonB dependent receptor